MLAEKSNKAIPPIKQPRMKTKKKNLSGNFKRAIRRDPSMPPIPPEAIKTPIKKAFEVKKEFASIGTMGSCVKTNILKIIVFI